MIHVLVLVAGFAAVAGVLALARVETALNRGPGTARLPDPFGDALSAILAWVSFAGLLAACLYTQGLVASIVAAGGSLTVGRLAPPAPALEPALGYKLPLAFGALAMAILALIEVMTIIEGALHG